MSQAPYNNTLKVDGAELYYEVQGAGPLLLLIPGGAQDAAVFGPLRRHLFERYTIITYDPRGNSRSRLDRDPADQQLDVHGDDAAHLLKTLNLGSALIFGTSGGAQIGLNLAARYSDLVDTLVAHEPPAMMMLEDPSQALASVREIYGTYIRDGVDAAMAKFLVMNDFSNGQESEDKEPPALPTPEITGIFSRMTGNLKHWLAHGLIPLSLYRPDVERLRSSRTRIVIGLGAASRGRIIYKAGGALARKLELRPTEFPGEHMGYLSSPKTFGDILHRVLSRREGPVAPCWKNGQSGDGACH